MSLASKTVHGLFWMSFSHVSIKLINFIITVILARILEPEDFGLFALGLMFVYFFEIFRDLGIGSALIYKEDDVDKAANTAFFLFPSVAIFFFLISYFVAPLVSDFFNEEQLTIILRVLSLSFVIWSFGTLPSILLDKNLEFKKQVFRQVAPKIIYGIVTVGLAISGFGVWSLVIGTLVFWLLSAIITWPLVDWRPSYKFDASTAFELLKYGKQVAIANVILFFISTVDLSFIGRILDTGSVGYYSIAIGIATLVTNQVSGVMNRVMFPVYSIIKTDTIYLKDVFVRTVRYVSLVTIPAAFGVFLIARDFIEVVYGDKWLPAVAALQVLCFYGMTKSLVETTDNLYLASGKPEIRTRFNFLQLFLMSVLIYPLTVHYGIFGTSLAVLMPSALVVILTFRKAGKLIDENFMYIAGSIAPFVKGSLLMLAGVSLMQYVMYPIVSSVFVLVLSIILGASIYSAFIWLAKREIFYEIRSLMLKK